jgi:CRISPR-associated protein Csm2
MAFNFKFDTEQPDAQLFNQTAEQVAIVFLREQLNQKGRDDNKDKNNSTQLRRFYDEVVAFHSKIGDSDERFSREQAFLYMLNAKAAYAVGRELVSKDFAEWLKDCLKATVNARSMNNFKLHFEAVLGFIRAERK